MPGQMVTGTSAPVVGSDGTVYILINTNFQTAPELYAVSTTEDVLATLWSIDLFPYLDRASAPTIDTNGYAWIGGDANLPGGDARLLRVNLTTRAVDNVIITDRGSAWSPHQASKSPPVIDADGTVYVGTTGEGSGGGGVIAAVRSNLVVQWRWIVPRVLYEDNTDIAYPMYLAPLSLQSGSAGGTHIIFAQGYYGDPGFGAPDPYKGQNVTTRLKITNNNNATAPTVQWIIEQGCPQGSSPCPNYIGAPALGADNFYLVSQADALSTQYRVVAFRKDTGAEVASASAPTDAGATPPPFRTVALTSAGDVVVGAQSIYVYNSALTSLLRSISVAGAWVPTVDNASTARIYFTDSGSVGVVRPDNSVFTTANIGAHEPVVPLNSTRVIVGTNSGLALLAAF